MLELLAPVLIFLAFLALFFARGDRPTWRRPADSESVWSGVPGLFFASGLVAVLAGFASNLLDLRIAAAIAAAGAVGVTVAGVRTALNRHGEAQAFARRFWTDQGLRVSHPIPTARAIGAAATLIGATGACACLGWLIVG